MSFHKCQLSDLLGSCKSAFSINFQDDTAIIGKGNLKYAELFNELLIFDNSYTTVLKG